MLKNTFCRGLNFSVLIKFCRKIFGRYRKSAYLCNVLINLLRLENAENRRRLTSTRCPRDVKKRLLLGDVNMSL